MILVCCVIVHVLVLEQIKGYTVIHLFLYIVCSITIYTYEYVCINNNLKCISL